MQRILLSASAAALFVPLMTSADDYQFIINGDPVAASTVNSITVASSATSIESGPMSCATAGIALRSDKYRGFQVVFR